MRIILFSMRIILSLVGIVGSFFMLKYREQVGDMFGEAEWMRKVGGVYNVVIFASAFVFIWSIAELTGTTSFFFGWFLNLLPGLGSAPEPAV